VSGPTQPWPSGAPVRAARLSAHSDRIITVLCCSLHNLRLSDRVLRLLEAVQAIAAVRQKKCGRLGGLACCRETSEGAT
jgi:hypothetical protein